MKIAMIGQKGIPARSGGIERHVEELSAELAALGHEVLVFCRAWYCPEQANAYRGARCIYVPTLKTKHLDAIVHTFLSIVRAARLQADVFHIHGVGPALLAWLPKLLRPQAKVVVTFHCIDRHHQKWNTFARAMLHLGEWVACRIPDATVSVAKTLQTYCRLSYGLTTAYIPNGTQIPMETPDASLIAPFALTSNRYLMFCARLVKHKGAHLLIEAWQHLRRESPELVGDFKLAIVGGSAFTDAYVRQLQAMAAGDESIVLTDVQTGETLHALFAHSYAVVHPSESEGLPITILEAMAHGRCVLASNIPENMELVAENGMQFIVGSKQDLVDKIKMMLSYPQHVAAVGREARAFVARQYDWKDIARDTSCLYESLTFARTATQEWHINSIK